MHRFHIFLLCLTFALFSGCNESSEDPEFSLTSALDGSGHVQLEICGNAENIYVALDTAAEADVNLKWEMSSPGYVSLHPLGEDHFTGTGTLLTYAVKCSDNPDQATSKEILLTATTQSTQESYSGLSSTVKITCNAGADESCLGNGTELPPSPVDCSQYPDCLFYDACDPSTCVPTDTPTIRIAPLSGIVTSEFGTTDAFQIVLGAKPTADVVITLQSSDTTEGQLPSPVITFTPNNWNTPQSVTIKGVDDTEADGDIAYTIDVASVVSQDSRYNNMYVASVKCTNKDNEPRTEAVSMTMKHNGATEFSLDLYETGMADSFTLFLNAEPVSDVTVHIASTNDEEMTVLTPEVTFTQTAWRAIKTIRVQGVPDKLVDGDKKAELVFTITSDDPRYAAYELAPISVTIHDTDIVYDGPVTVRMMAANTTSGNNQSYDPGHGKRIFQAMKPDIVMIQEFNMQTDTIDNFVRSTFGNAYNYYRGTGDLPNGIISRYPILSTGQWKSPQISNRGFNWAIIDIPGDKELFAISVHLSTKTSKQISEMASLQTQIAGATTGYYVVLGGDFNTSTHNVVKTNLSDAFPKNATLSDAYWPCDQKGNIDTNADRESQHDYVLASDDLHALAVPIIIGEHTYPYGHVFDSRVYYNLGELDDVPPVQADDSGALNMQHMAVIRDFQFTP